MAKWARCAHCRKKWHDCWKSPGKCCAQCQHYEKEKGGKK